MKKNCEANPVASLIREALPEMSRIKSAAELGFDARLRKALGQQSTTSYLAWEDAAKRSVKMAGGLTAVIVLQFGCWIGASNGDGLRQSSFAIERLLLGN